MEEFSSYLCVYVGRTLNLGSSRIPSNSIGHQTTWRRFERQLYYTMCRTSLDLSILLHKLQCVLLILCERTKSTMKWNENKTWFSTFFTKEILKREMSLKDSWALVTGSVCKCSFVCMYQATRGYTRRLHGLQIRYHTHTQVFWDFFTQ